MEKKGLLKTLNWLSLGFLIGGLTVAFPMGVAQVFTYNDLTKYYDNVPESYYSEDLEILNNELASGKINNRKYNSKLQKVKEKVASEFYKDDADFQALKKKAKGVDIAGWTGLGVFFLGGVGQGTVIGLTQTDKEKEQQSQEENENQ